MSCSRGNVWIHRLAWMLAVATLFLIGLGGVVTTKGVGMAVPDWPTTYGDHMFLFPFSKWVGGVFDEHSHRLWASIVALVTAALAIWVWCLQSRGVERAVGVFAMIATLGLLGVRTSGVFVVMACAAAGVIVYSVARLWRGPRELRWFAVIAFAVVLIQGVLGGLRVLLDDSWGMEFGIFHAALAQLFLLLVGTLVLFTSRWWSAAGQGVGNPSLGLRGALLATTALIFAQLLLGAAMRHQHAGLAVPDFPLAYGKLWPATDSASVALYNQHRLEAAGEHPIKASHIVVHMLHRAMAVLILVGIMACAVLAFRRTAAGSLTRKLAVMWVGLVLLQVTLGMFTIWSQRKVDVTTAHVAVGALTFLAGWVLFLASSREWRTAGTRVTEKTGSPLGSELTTA